MGKREEMPQRGRRIGKGVWILAARDALIDGGIEGVKIGRLAKAIKATRPAFYWHFEDREELLLKLLDDWKANSTRLYEGVVNRAHDDGKAHMDVINTMWLEEECFDPAFDAAVREWARVSASVAKVVREGDRKRINILKAVFIDLGYEETEAFVRARVAYFHQIGYLALGLNESKKTRRELAPVYLKVLLGS